MNYFFWLMIIYIVYTMMAFLFTNGKILSPSFVFSASFTFMISLAYIFKDILGFEVGQLTFSIFVTGGFLFLFTEYLVANFYGILRERRGIGSPTPIPKDREPLRLNRQIQRLMMVELLVSLLIAIVVLYMNTSGGTMSSRMGEYKNNLLYGSQVVRYRFVVSLLYKVNTCVVYLVGYVFVYNSALCKVKVRSQIELIIIVVQFCIFSMVAQAARQPAIEIILFLPIVYVSLLMRAKDKKKVRKLVLRAVPVAVIAVFAFYFTSTMVGRRKTQRGIWEYLAVYFCGGLYSFNLHVNEPARNEYWGQSSFADVYNLLIKLGLAPSDANAQYHDFDLYGNTVTLFGRWYEDFGQTGVYTMSVLVALFFAVFFYRRVVPAANARREHDVARLIYCKLIISLVWAGYDDRIRAILSTQTLFFLVGIYLLWTFCIKRNIKFKIR